MVTAAAGSSASFREPRLNPISWLAGKLGYVKPAARARYGYDAAQISRLTASLQAESQFINSTLRFQLRTLRARSRQAAQNNPIARRFANMVVANVCGPVPFKLEGKVINRKGKPDEKANELIESTWCAWGRPGNCDVTGKWSWSQLQRLLVRNLAVDGELIFRKLKGPEYGRYGMKLQVIDVDRLYERKNESLANGGAIHAGVEVDVNGKPVAYHLLRRQPAQWQYAGYTFETDRIPADEIVHIFIPEFAEQVRGVPWMYAALLNLVHLGAFEEAAVVAARLGAANMGFIESPDGGDTLAQQQGQDADSTTPSEPYFTAEPGSFPLLPPGYKFSGSWNPQFPQTAVEPFIRATLRGIAAGLDVAYHNLANDLENVNYSSARIGELDERDAWMQLQNFMVEHLHQPLYDEWLKQQVMASTLPFEPNSLDKYRAVYWQPRRWAWVDPAKEVKAAVDAIEANIKSRTRVIAESGEDIEDVFSEIAAEAELAKAKGIDLTLPKQKPAQAPAAPAEQEPAND